MLKLKKALLLMLSMFACVFQAAFVYVFSLDTPGRRRLENLWQSFDTERTVWSVWVFGLIDSGMVWLLVLLCFCGSVYAVFRPNLSAIVWFSILSVSVALGLTAAVYWPSMMIRVS